MRGIVWRGWWVAAAVAVGVPALAAPPPTSDRCGECHRDIYRMWSGSAHATTMENPEFLDAFREVEAAGQRELAARCLDCHAPMAAVTGDAEALALKTSWEGVNCDFCHSIVAVEPAATRPLPRVRVGEVKRGPITEADPVGHETAYSKLHESSLVCAPCHEYANDEGVGILTTYSEWQQSEAASRGQQCQACHMALARADVVDPRLGRSPRARVNLHEMPGGHSLQQLYRALRVSMEVDRADGRLQVTVRVANRGAGHAVPTGMPGRRIVLGVEVATSDDRHFEESRVYSRDLVDARGKPIERVADYFRRGIEQASDTRIGVDEIRRETFGFDIEPDATAWISATLHYEHAGPGPGEEYAWHVFFEERRMVRGSGRARRGEE